jgi:hypothetical protein
MVEQPSKVPAPPAAGGDSEVWFEEPYTIFVAMRGYISDDECARIFRAQSAYMAGLRYLILVCDMQAFTGISLGARRQLVERGKQGPPCAVVIVGASYPMRSLAQIVSRAMVSLGILPAPGYRFARDLAEARGLLPTLRSELESRR